MKGKIFIAWSAVSENSNKNEVAIAVSEKLSKYDYIGIVGGQSGTGGGLHVGAAVLNEIDQCNQAILIIQKKPDGTISNNVMFEFGYALKRFNAKRIHVFYIDIAQEDKNIPSDIKGIWAKFLKSDKSDDLAEDIVDIFLENQKNIIDEDKMNIIDEYYDKKSKIAEYHEKPFCSEYELAQYILFFGLSSYIFDDVAGAARIITELENKISNPDNELEYVLRFIMCYLNINLFAVKEETSIYLKKEDFRNIRRRLKSVQEEIDSWDSDNDFTLWFKMLVNDVFNYFFSLYASSPALDDEQKAKYFGIANDYAKTGLQLCEELLQNDFKKENYYVVQLHIAYMYRNMFTAYRNIATGEEAYEMLRKSFNARKTVLNHYENKSLSKKLFDNIELEYYLGLSECLEYIEDEDDYMEFKDECEDYIKRVKNLHTEKNFYINKIERFISDRNA